MHEISSDNIEELAIPCMIPETCRNLGLFMGRYHACYMHGSLPIFHAWNVHVPCMESGAFHAYSMCGSGAFHAWYRHIPCVVQVYFMRGVGGFHAWYWRIPHVVQPCVCTVRGTVTGIPMHAPCTVQDTYRFCTCILYL